MMETIRQRVTLPFTAVIAGAVIGCVAGCLLGRMIVFHQVTSRLDREATRLVTQGDISTAESRDILHKMNASQLPFCSEAEIDSFRKLVYKSRFLKEAGRMSGDTIACSTTLGAPSSASEHFQPSYRQADGTSIYLNLAPFRVPRQSVIAVRLGDSFVIYNPYGFWTNTPKWIHFTVTDMDKVTRHPGQLSGEKLQSPGIELFHEGQARFNNRIFLTHCSKDGEVCLTSYTTIAEALNVNRLEFAGYVASGALAGCLFGLICPFLYRKNKGIEKQLLRAIRKDALRVVYQPIIDLNSREVVGAEALVRWNDEDNLAVPPDVFVRIAEERGFVGKITRIVVEHALRDFSTTLRALPDFRINVNIAASDLADNEFVPMLDRALFTAGVSARNLGIEITESYTARQQAAKDTILRLRRKGHAVHIDDFGTGFSSLAYLYELSVDAIKIDRAFVRAIGTEAVTVTILPQILSMARQLNLGVVVEGIETREQAEYFSGSSLEMQAQGWLFGRPVPAEEFIHKYCSASALNALEEAPGLTDAIAV
jgi:sensor c-di-GMP phosphodiesterase-like protein